MQPYLILRISDGPLSPHLHQHHTLTISCLLVVKRPHQIIQNKSEIAAMLRKCEENVNKSGYILYGFNPPSFWCCIGFYSIRLLSSCLFLYFWYWRLGGLKCRWQATRTGNRTGYWTKTKLLILGRSDQGVNSQNMGQTKPFRLTTRKSLDLIHWYLLSERWTESSKAVLGVTSTVGVIYCPT